MRIFAKRLFSRAALLGNAALLIVASSLWLPSAMADAGQTLKLGLAGEPQTLDPHRYNLRLEETLLNDLFMGLTTFDAAGEIVPGCATHWDVSEDGLTWTFHLREDLKWSDGTPLTATDFVYAQRRLQDPKTAASLAYFMHMLHNAEAINAGQLPTSELGISAPDATTVVMQLAKPYPYLLERLLYPTAFPVPAHVIEKVGDAWVKPEHWVSNGAYVLDAWIPRARVALRRNPEFYAPAAITSVHYIPVDNEQTAYNRFRTGDLHVIGSFPAAELPGLQASQPEKLRLSNLLSMMYLVFNTTTAPFDDVRVRQALALTIDQEILTERVLKTGNRPEVTFTPDLVKDFDGAPLPHAGQPRKQRVAAAHQLLAAAGYSQAKPLEVTLRHVNGIDNKKANLAITGMWRELGVRAKLQQADLRTHFAALREGDFSVAWAGWVGENNAEHYLSLLQSSIGNVNYGRFSNTTFDQVMAQAQQTADSSARNNLLQTAASIAVNYYPVVPLYSNAVRRLVEPSVGGWLENGRDMHQSRYLYWQ